MPRADITIEIVYDIDKLENSTIKTNAKKDAVLDILEQFALSQVGTGSDAGEANNKDEYKITIHLDMSDDTFYVTSDTGNKGLTCGIVMHIISQINSIEIIAL